jgi:hypothetical protein
MASGFLELRHASTERAIFVVVPERRFLAIDGLGDPVAADFRIATAALRSVAEIVGRRLHREGIPTPTGQRLVECAWWPKDTLEPDALPAAFADRSTWHWRQLIELPAGAAERIALAAIDEARRAADRDVALVRFMAYTEGAAAQLLHVGPRSLEPASVHKLYGDILAAGLHPDGRLHALTLADPDAAPRGVGRSIFRQPVA